MIQLTSRFIPGKLAKIKVNISQNALLFLAITLLDLFPFPGPILASTAPLVSVHPMVRFPNITIDQFGYLPSSRKIAVIRSPVTGFDASDKYSPSDLLTVMNDASTQIVLKLSPKPWRNGATDPVSGDRVWWLDFSQLTKPGRYYILDEKTKTRSPPFSISAAVYRPVLIQALRTFYYQRAGIVKLPHHAGSDWSDSASHMRPGQDRNCRRYDAKGDASTERDLHGGWYDAGDYNKYTSWTASYIISLLRAYSDNTSAFGDDTNIPESGNQIPDVIDEARWGLDWLARMQNQNGSVLSIVGLAAGSPPSTASGASYYGPASTSASLSAAGAFAYAAVVLRRHPAWAWDQVAADYLLRAKQAFDWAEKFPEITFRNNEASNHSTGLGAGQQEMDDYGRLVSRVSAAYYLYIATSDEKYRQIIEVNIQKIQMVKHKTLSPYEQKIQEILLEYQADPRSSELAKQQINSAFKQGFLGDNFSRQAANSPDAYLSYIKEYTWGSNSTKAAQGLVYVNAAQYAGALPGSATATEWAQHYLHYLHGVNPLGLVYLTNMNGFGATNSLTRIFHTWFSESSSRWGATKAGSPGPAPGFLAGGPNSYYRLDACCPKTCGGLSAQARCDEEKVRPPLGQPPTKSFRDFNDGWPRNSWEISENSNGYQVNYIRLLANFVR